MDIDTSIDLIAQWLEAVDVTTAGARVAEAQARHHAKSAVFREPLSTDAARHEAAHAITACQLGLRVDYVRVLEDGSGCAAYEADPTSPVAMLARVVADLAGISGELLEDDVHPWRRTRLAESCDVLVARLNADVCQSLVPAWQLSHRFFAMMSCAVVLSNIDLIAKVAQALRTCGCLDGPRIAALCWLGPK